MTKNYVFTRDYLDNNRLNLHHYLMKELWGYLLHPSISLERDGLRIADIGTGTGIWLTDLARQLPPSTSLDGFDISFESIPPTQWLPKNITLHSYDILSPVPDEFVGTYDIVHVRYFIFVLKDEEINAAMSNVHKMLKPGGYLQWEEPDTTSFKIVKTHPNNKVEALNELLQLSQPKDPRLRPTWAARLPELFREERFDSIEQDENDPSPDMLMHLHECNLMIHEILARKAQNSEWEKALEDILPEVLRESRQGAAWSFIRHLVVGRKAL